MMLSWLTTALTISGTMVAGYAMVDNHLNAQSCEHGALHTPVDPFGVNSTEWPEKGKQGSTVEMGDHGSFERVGVRVETQGSKPLRFSSQSSLRAGG